MTSSRQWLWLVVLRRRFQIPFSTSSFRFRNAKLIDELLSVLWSIEWSQLKCSTTCRFLDNGESSGLFFNATTISLRTLLALLPIKFSLKKINWISLMLSILRLIECNKSQHSAIRIKKVVSEKWRRTQQIHPKLGKHGHFQTQFSIWSFNFRKINWISKMLSILRLIECSKREHSAVRIKKVTSEKRRRTGQSLYLIRVMMMIWNCC